MKNVLTPAEKQKDGDRRRAGPPAPRERTLRVHAERQPADDTEGGDCD